VEQKPGGRDPAAAIGRRRNYAQNIPAVGGMGQRILGVDTDFSKDCSTYMTRQRSSEVSTSIARHDAGEIIDRNQDANRRSSSTTLITKRAT